MKSLQLRLFLAGITLLLPLHAGSFKHPKKMIIGIPVTHLMSSPQTRHDSHQKSCAQITQLLFGEHVMAYEEHKGLLRVKALEQKGFWKGSWIQCCGWIPVAHAHEVEQFPTQNLVVTSHTAPLLTRDSQGKKCITLSFGSKLCASRHASGMWGVKLPDNSLGLISDNHVSPLAPLPHNELRQALVSRGTQFIGDPYVWAGRSAYSPSYSNISGTDCSGLISLLYQSAGIQIPRCSHDQYTKSTKIARLDERNVGDLIFVYYQDPHDPDAIKKRISHVLMYLGNDRLLEAEGDLSGHVRVVLGHQRFGKPIEQIKSGDIVWQYKNFAESPLGNKKVVSESRYGRCKLVFGSYID